MSADLYSRLHEWLAARRRGVLIVAFLLVAVSVGLSTRIHLREDILDTLPQDDRQVDEYRYALRKFRQIDRLYFDVGVDRDDPDLLARAADGVAAALTTNSALANVLHRVDPGGQTKIIEFLTGALPNLFTEADALALEQKLEPAEVRAYLATMRRKLAGPEGMVLKDVVAADPIGGSALVVDKVLPLQTGFGDAQLVNGRITSADGRHVLILAEPAFSSADMKASEQLVAGLLKLAGGVAAEFPGVHVAITGGHRMAVDNATLIKADATRCIFLGMGAMFVLCWTVFRRRWLALAAFLPSFFGTALAGLVLALWQPELSAIATGFAIIAIGITVDYAIHLIYHLDDAAGMSARAVGRHVGRLVMPISAGALTSMAAFAVMAASPMSGYRQLGVFGVFGVLFSAVFALVVLPLLVPVPRKAGQPPLWLTRCMDWFHAWQMRSRPWFLVGLLALTVGMALGVNRLRFDGDLARLNGITESTRTDDEIIQSTWGHALGMTMVVSRGATLDEALARNDRTAEQLATQPGVSGVHSLASVCPSRATQEANLRRWREFWNPDRRDALRRTLAEVGGELGYRPAAFDAFWRIVEKEPPLLTVDQFRGTPLEQALSERVAAGADDNAVSTLVRLEDRTQAAALREALPDSIVLDQKDFADHVAGLARSGLGRFVVWTAILVAVIVYLMLGSVELLVAVLLPLAFGLLWTFGLMGWLGLPIDMMNSVFVVFIIGIGEDYNLFLVTSKLDEWRGQPSRMGATSASVMISVLTTLFGFAVLVFAGHPVLFSMGTTVLIGMGFTALATLVLTPLFMDLLLFKDQPRGAPRAWHLLFMGAAGGVMVLTQLLLYGVLWPALALIDRRRAKARLWNLTRWITRQVLIRLPFGSVEFQSIAPATFSPPCIVISNHVSALDVLLMVAMPGDVRQTPKKRVFDTPTLGIGCKIFGHVPVDPDDPEVTLKRCRETLAGGASVHFYPEGTRSPDGWPIRFRRGAFKLAVELKQDILPIVFCDTHVAVPRDAYWMEPYRATVRALPRVTPETFDYSKGSLALMQHCEALMRASLQEQLDEVNTPRVVRRKVHRLYRYQGKFVEQFTYWKLRNDPVFGVLDGLVPREGFILDLGCGYGLGTHWLACFTDRRTFLGVDYDEDKIRVACRTAPDHARITFRRGDILEDEYPACDAVLLVDVLHYWVPEKQQFILEKARRALRPGGRLIVRDGARGDDAGHRRVHFWERIATRIGHNKTREGLHFLPLTELEAMLRRAGFATWELHRDGGSDSNVMLAATVE